MSDRAGTGTTPLAVEHEDRPELRHHFADVVQQRNAASLGMCSSNVWAITQTLAGPRAAGRWTGIENFVGNLGGAVAPALTGFVLGRTGHYFWAFAITAVVSLLGALSWAFWIGRVEPVVWASQDRGGATPG